VDVFEFELVVLAAEVVEVVDAAAVDAAPGGMTLKLTVAPHSSRVWPLSQQPPSEQYVPASQYSLQPSQLVCLFIFIFIDDLGKGGLVY
jgi:hypothetical protein